MTIEQHCENIRRQISDSATEFRAKMHTVMSSGDYALLIADLATRILTSTSARKLWCDRLGLSYCVFVVPSEMFVMPVKALFSIEADSKLGPEETIYGTERDLGNSFFSRHLISARVVQVRLLESGQSPGEGSSRGRRPNHLIYVSNDLMKYIDESAARSGDGETITFDTTDGRFQDFLSQNISVIKRLFHPSLPPIPRLVGAELRDALALRCVSALMELTDVAELSRTHPHYIYLIPGAHNGPYPGVCCFMFQREVGPAYRVLLRFLCNQMLESARALEQAELQRRSVIAQQELAAKESYLHALRTNLGTLGNKLHVLRSVTKAAAGADSLGHVDEAIECHASVLECVDKFESAARSTHSYEGELINLRLLEYALILRFKRKFLITINILPTQGREEFELPGKWEDLAESLFQFVDGALNAVERVSPKDEPSTDNPAVDVFLYLAEKDSTLFIRVYSQCALPPIVKEAMASVTILGRLPSSKSAGGRGLLSAISSIRTNFRGHCELSTEDGTDWGVWIPVKIDRQYSLFRSASDTISEFLDKSILRRHGTDLKTLVNEISTSLAHKR